MAATPIPRRVLDAGIAFIRQVRRKAVALIDWSESEPDGPNQRAFDAAANNLTAAFDAELQNVASEAGIAFWSAIDEILDVDLLRTLSDADLRVAGEEFATQLARRLSLVVRNWLFLAPLANVDHWRRAIVRISQIGDFTLLPALKSQRGFRRLSTLTRRLRRLTNNSRLPLDGANRIRDIYDHLERKWSGGLSSFPLLAMHARGSDYEARSACERRRYALTTAVQVHEPVYGGAHGISSLRLFASTVRDREPNDRWLMLVDEVSGAIDVSSSFREITMPPFVARMKAKRANVLALESILSGRGARPLERRIRRAAEMFSSAEDMKLDAHLRFLLRIIGLETVAAAPGRRGGLTRALAHGIASLIARDPAEYDRLYAMVESLYETRSNFVHHGEVPPQQHSPNPADVFSDASDERRAKWLLSTAVQELLKAREYFRGQNEPDDDVAILRAISLRGWKGAPRWRGR